jgi:hypothetical protein
VSWWQRELDKVIAWLAALIVGLLVWAVSQWASDALWADVAGSVGAVVVTFWLLNKYLCWRQRERWGRTKPGASIAEGT